MHKANIEINQIKSLFPKLSTNDLEEFLLEIKTIIGSRKNSKKGNKETELIEKLNETVLPESSILAYQAIINKRATNELSEDEQTQLDKLIEEDLILQTKRIHILGELAKLRNKTVAEVMEGLGLQTPPSV